MSYSLIPRSFWSTPSFSSFFDEDDFNIVSQNTNSGLSVYEQDNSVCVEAPLPGLKAEDIEVTMHKGVLWISGEAKQEESDEDKKYYKKSAKSFSYKVAVPGEIDESVEPEASYQDGVMTVKFTKSEKAQPKKIEVKSS